MISRDSVPLNLDFFIQLESSALTIRPQWLPRELEWRHIVWYCLQKWSGGLTEGVERSFGFLSYFIVFFPTQVISVK